MALIADIFITTKNRGSLLRETIETLRENTDRSQYRLTVVRDGNYANTSFLEEYGEVDYILTSRENRGLGPSINMALAHIDSVNRWYDTRHPGGDLSKVAPFVCYIQDDILVSKDWLPKMYKMYMLTSLQYKLGFASGIECVEHQVRKDLGNGMILKDWIRAANMFGPRDYWMSMFPIPALDWETGRARAKPNDGIGSGVDWWFIRNHEYSVCKTGRTNLVFPGMMVHAGYDQSTWLARELPESEEDKKKIEELK